MLKFETKFSRLALTLAGVLALALTTRADDLKPVFNGKDLTKKGSMLWTEKGYCDFVIECEARWSGEIDSGIILRKPELQLQMGVSRSVKKDMTCSFYTGGK
jgi:hypothetical protein